MACKHGLSVAADTKNTDKHHMEWETGDLFVKLGKELNTHCCIMMIWSWTAACLKTEREKNDKFALCFRVEKREIYYSTVEKQ